MPVISLRTDISRASNVLIQAAMFGIDLEVVERNHPHKILIDLIGTEEKARLVAEKTGAEIIGTVEFVEF